MSELGLKAKKYGETTMANEIIKYLGEEAARLFAAKVKEALEEAKKKYAKPTDGIPEADLAQAVKDALAKAKSALQSIPEDVVRKADLKTLGVTSFNGSTGDVTVGDASESAGGFMTAQHVKDLNTLLALLKDDDEDTVVNTIAEVLKVFETYPEGADIAKALAEKYVKPTAGIPLTDLAEAIRTSLGRADTALQSGDFVEITEEEVNALFN